MEGNKPDKRAISIKVFTAKDIRNLVADLTLYSGNIKGISKIVGPEEHNAGAIDGIIHTSMDEFPFSAMPIYSDDESWTIHLGDPVESLRHGQRMLVLLRFPKLHKDPELQKRYQLANFLYDRYSNYSNIVENDRLREYERQLGYDRLRTFQKVMTRLSATFVHILKKRMRRESGTRKTERHKTQLRYPNVPLRSPLANQILANLSAS